MSKIEIHPILKVPVLEKITFLFEGKYITTDKGITIAAALHRAGYPIHSHSLKNRVRSLQCGIGKCGACEMLVDGEIRRICITKVDGIGEVKEIPREYIAEIRETVNQKVVNIYKTTVAIIGAGPAGLACREELLRKGIDNIVIDNNERIGGQFIMQTHQFFFFEKEKKFGGMRGFNIARQLAGDSHEGILLNSSVWDVLDGKRIGVKNIRTDEIYYIDAEYMVVATGAVPSMPVFENDDLPGVYTAAVVQKMMNNEFTLLGKNVLTVGAGNIGYLTSYQLMQAGATVKAIIEAQPVEGGFPVQANRVRRLGIPILTSHILLKAIPNKTHTGITGAVVADCKNFKPIPGSEKIIEGIDVINVCTGLAPDNQLITKGNVVFGRKCYGAGDAMHIGEGTSAVLRGRQVAYEILQDLGEDINNEEYLGISKEYFDSLQHPVQRIQEPYTPAQARFETKPFVQIDCLFGFACNPCEFACPHEAISKTSTSAVPQIDFEKCTGCMDCISQCPGLAIFGYAPRKDEVFLPLEYFAEENAPVFLVDNSGKKIGTGVIEKILKKPNNTNVAKVKVSDLHGDELLKIRGFIVQKDYPQPLEMRPITYVQEQQPYLCHCEDISVGDFLSAIGDRKIISIGEIKHITRLGAGPCRGQLCIGRLKSLLKDHGVVLTGEATPRGPLSNQLSVGEFIKGQHSEKVFIGSSARNIRKVEVGVLIAGGGIAGSALFRYFANAGLKPVLINYGRGSSWRNIAAGRAVFGIQELADIARHNLEIFKDLQKISNINFKSTRFVNFIHDEVLYKVMENSRAWSGGRMVESKDFRTEISPYINPILGKNYPAAFITPDCWQATPGLVVDLIRRLGEAEGGQIVEDCQLIDVHRDKDKYIVLVKNHEKQYVEFHARHFANALGADAEKFASQLGFETGLYPVKHQAFITRRLPKLGIDGQTLDMLIDRSKHNGFTNFYGQQLLETGQIIGCAEPVAGMLEVNKDLKINTKDFLETVFEKIVDWLPQISSVGIQAVWAGYYVEPRMIVDPEKGLLVGLQGSGFMFSQYLAKMYVDKYVGKDVPSYLERLSLSGDGLRGK